MHNPPNNYFYFGFLLSLTIVFIIYNGNIYSDDIDNCQNNLSKEALIGETIWQQNSCFHCHQLYGLGGYLGPDLTNIYSDTNKGPNYINAFLTSGIKSMPKFHFSKSEKLALIVFLKEVDQTGYYPNRNATIHPNGWVEIQTKNEK
jgi:nitric oxide reductase subunit C